MRIGIDARFYGSLGKGLGRYTEKLIDHLERIDTDNEYVIFLRRENFSEYIPKNPRFQKKQAHYPWYSFSEQFLFLRCLYREKLDLMHFPHFNVPLFYRRPFVVTIHDLILLHYPTLRNTTRGVVWYLLKYVAYKLVISSAIRRAKRILTVSHFTRKDIERHTPFARGKIAVTYEAADAFCQILSQKTEQQILQRLEIVSEKKKDSVSNLRDIIRPYFLYVGNAYPHKNLETLLFLAEEMPAYLFVLVGKEDYFYRRLKLEAQKRKLQNVVFAGFLNDAELSVLYRYGLLYIFPSLYEGFGLPPLEAMARGLPVLSSNRGSLPEILGDAALYFDPENKASIHQAVLRCIHDQVLLREMRAKGYAQVARYSFERMAEETKKQYQESIEKKFHE